MGELATAYIGGRASKIPAQRAYCRLPRAVHDAFRRSVPSACQLTGQAETLRARCVESREDVTVSGPGRRALSGLALPASRAPALERRRPASPAGLTARAMPEARPDRRAANLGGESDHSIPVPPQAMHSPSRPRGRQTVQPWLYAGGSLWTSPVPSQYLHLPVPSQSLQAAMCVPPRKMVRSCE
jgi:hypothetical protein